MKRPTHAHIDADSLVYAAAVAAQTTTYALIDTQTGGELKQFRKHKDYTSFCELLETGFEQLPVPIEQTRLEKTTTALAFTKATKALSKLLKQWVELTGCEHYTCYVGDPANSTNFRNDIATLAVYKGNRKGRDKPIYLQQLREYAINLPHFRAISGIEADDASLAAAEADGKNGCLAACDKDAEHVVGCWYINPDRMKEPVYSPRNTVGYVELKANSKANSKVTGLGYLRVLSQCLTGDSVDNIIGVPKFGPIKAVRLLEPFNNKPWVERGDAVRAVMKAYQDYYGDAHTYTHAYTGEEITKSWREILDENFLLLWMQRNNDKTGEVLAKYWRNENV